MIQDSGNKPTHYCYPKILGVTFFKSGSALERGEAHTLGGHAMLQASGNMKRKQEEALNAQEAVMAKRASNIRVRLEQYESHVNHCYDSNNLQAAPLLAIP